MQYRPRAHKNVLIQNDIYSQTRCPAGSSIGISCNCFSSNIYLFILRATAVTFSLITHGTLYWACGRRFSSCIHLLLELRFVHYCARRVFGAFGAFSGISRTRLTWTRVFNFRILLRPSEKKRSITGNMRPNAAWFHSDAIKQPNEYNRYWRRSEGWYCFHINTSSFIQLFRFCPMVLVFDRNFHSFIIQWLTFVFRCFNMAAKLVWWGSGSG